MSVYYLKAQSNYGDSAGLTGYFYPLYTDPSLIDGLYHSHTFVGLDDVVFYMPMGQANHAVKYPPSVSSHGGIAYQEYAKYNLNINGGIFYTDLPTAPKQQVISVAAYTPRQVIRPSQRTTNVESSRVEDLIPIQLRESSETLISLLSDYYNYLNQQDQTTDIFNRIVSEQDIDSTSLDYLDRLQNEIAKTVPESRTLDKVSLYKRIVKYYSIRGSEESVLVFFRLFFDELVEVLYPKDFLLKPSDGDWISNDLISNYSDFIEGFAPLDENFNEQNLNDLITFRDSGDSQIATGQIIRVENLISLSNEHPVNDRHIIELDSRESERYDATDLDEPTFKPFNPSINADAQSTALLKGGVTYSPTEGFAFGANTTGTWTGSHIDLGRIYDTENITEVTNRFSMVARVKNNRIENTAVAHIFNTSYAFPSHSLGFRSGKLGLEIWKWGSFYGYNSTNVTGSTSVPLNEWSTIAIRGKRDYQATSSAGGTGWVEVSVNAEAWERIWDDSDYGTPTSFNIKNVLSKTGAFTYSVNNFTDSGTTFNGKPVYTSTTLEKSGTGSDSIMDNATAFEIKFYNDLSEIGFSQPEFQNEVGVYGYWILNVISGGTTNQVIMWPDINTAVEMYETSYNPQGSNTNIKSQYTAAWRAYISNEISVGTGHNDGPNNSGVARTTFFDVIKDFNRQLRNSSGTYIVRRPIHYRQDLYTANPNTPTASFESNDKQLTWVTTNEFLDVKDKEGHLRLGVYRWNHYYRGNILHFSYLNKELSQSDLNKIHSFYNGFYRNRWGLRVKVDENTSIVGANTISDSTNSVYTLSDLSGPKINEFWTYDENKFGSILNGFKIGGTNGVINWGDGSVPIAYSSQIAVQHTFGPSAALLGQYDNRKGFVSDVNKLQDSDYWQDYSYEIRSGLQNTEWANEYLRLVHPAGMKLFAALLLQIVRKNIWTGYTNYREPNPQEEGQLSKWLKKLIPPSRRDDINEDGYHMPFYQPGWLSVDIRSLSLLAQALVFAGEDARSGGDIFERTVQIILRFLIESNSQNRNQRVLEQQLGAQKFFDSDVRSGDYAYLTANELGNSETKLSPSQSYESNIVSPVYPWSLGTGDDNTYGTNNEQRYQRSGLIEENIRTWRTDPFGKLNVVWVAKDLDTNVNAEGGFHTPVIDIDASENKTYRFSVWLKQQNNNGKKYFGVYGRDTGGDITSDSIRASGETSGGNSNPYFWSGDLATNNEWYLLVGFLRPEDGTIQKQLSNDFAGIYNTAGKKVKVNNTEWKYLSDVDGLRLRAYHFSNPANQGDEVEMWGPRIDVVDGNEPTVEELIFPTIDSDILYGIKKRPSSKVVYKLNNFSTTVLGVTESINVNSITTTNIDYNNQQNYNENLKFIDNTKIGAYYNSIVDGESSTIVTTSLITNYVTLNPPESDRSYSSVYNNDPVGTGHARSMLDSLQAWSPALGLPIGSEYMQIDLGANKTISGVVTQGRYNFAQWVTSYKVEYSTNGTNWAWVDGESVFSGNSDQYTRVTNNFNINVSARYIKIYPVTYSGYPSMRAGVVEEQITTGSSTVITKAAKLSQLGAYVYRDPPLVIANHELANASGTFWTSIDESTITSNTLSGMVLFWDPPAFGTQTIFWGDGTSETFEKGDALSHTWPSSLNPEQFTTGELTTTTNSYMSGNYRRGSSKFYEKLI